jgi:hypothetical protein
LRTQNSPRETDERRQGEKDTSFNRGRPGYGAARFLA